jgi:hypothetical protein
MENLEMDQIDINGSIIEDTEEDENKDIDFKYEDIQPEPLDLVEL